MTLRPMFSPSLAAVVLAGCASGGAAADEPPADASVTDAPAEAYSGPCVFSADAFDLSCTTDRDCVAVSPSYYCSPAQCGCSAIAISRSALAQFNAEVAGTPLGSGMVEGVDCGCPLFAGGMCCVNGMCQTDCPSNTSPGITCRNAAGCLPGQVCCGTTDVTTNCQVGPCPTTTQGPLQACSTSAECMVAGDTCGPPPIAGFMLMVCNAPNGGDGGSSGDAGGTSDAGLSDAPAGG